LAVLENSLRTGISSATDSNFIAALIALTTPIAATGATAADVLFDLRILMDAAGSGANSRFHLAVGPAVARRLALMSSTTGERAFSGTVNGGDLAGVTVHASDALDDDALLLDASALALAADPVSVRVSPNALIEMDSAPSSAANNSGSPPTSVGSSAVSMFASDSTAILCERTFGFEVMRSSAVQSLEGITWGQAGSPLV
jgi:hypothetical protein